MDFSDWPVTSEENIERAPNIAPVRIPETIDGPEDLTHMGTPAFVIRLASFSKIKKMHLANNIRLVEEWYSLLKINRKIGFIA